MNPERKGVLGWSKEFDKWGMGGGLIAFYILGIEAGLPIAALSAVSYGAADFLQKKLNNRP